MTKTQIRKIDKQVEKFQQAIASDRDKLDDYISELEGLSENCQDAWDSLQNARDALSEAV